MAHCIAALQDRIPGRIAERAVQTVDDFCIRNGPVSEMPTGISDVAAHLEAAGAKAAETAPLAWLRYEEQPGDRHFSLRLRTWPGDERLLAWTHPHGRSVDWLAD